MMILGMFVFGLSTLAYQELQRQTEWKHPSNAVVGARDVSQFTGKGDDVITLNGWVAPELTGSMYSLDALRFMADTGKAWILIQGTGRIIGNFVITSMREGKTYFASDGEPARVDFTVTLKRVDIASNATSMLGDVNSLKSMLNVDNVMNGF